MRQLDSITDSMDMNLRKFWEIVEDRGAWRATVYGIAKSRTQQLNSNKFFPQCQNVGKWQLLNEYLFNE